MIRLSLLTQKLIICFVFASTFLLSSFSQPSKLKELSILYTHSGHGYLKACSCTKGKIGGVARRKTVFKQQRKKFRNLLALDAGNSLSGFPSSSNKFMLELMEHDLNYDAIHISTSDIKSGASFPPSISVSSNFKWKTSRGVSSSISKIVSGEKILILGATTESAIYDFNQQGDESPSIEPIFSSIKRELSLQKDASFIILLLHSFDHELEKRLAKAIPQIDLIISTGIALLENVPTFYENTVCVGLRKGAEEVGFINLAYHPKTKEKHIKTHEIFLLGQQVKKDKEILAKISNLKKIK